MPTRFLRNCAAAFLALSFTACGDSTAPSLNLSEEQVADMMDALSTAGLAGFGAMGGGFAVVTINETVDCPEGGSATVNASIDDGGGTGTSVSMTITQGFSNCKATSSQGRQWTFNGNPNLVSTFSGTSNEQTGAFSFSGTQKGGITAASNLGSGACTWDVTYSMSGNDITGALSGSVTGTVCGRSVSQTITAQ